VAHREVRVRKSAISLQRWRAARLSARPPHPASA